MADQDLKRRRWLAESPELDRLLSVAELDTPPPGLEARLLQRLREAELLQALSSSASDAAEALVDPAVTAAEPAHIPNASGSRLRAKPVGIAVSSALLTAAAGALLWWGKPQDPSRGDALVNAERDPVEARWYTASEQSSPPACTGTYFIRESNGSVNLWTFHSDGTLVNTSLGERASNFSTQHGSWKAVGPLSARAVQLDLHWASDGTFASVGRVDITIRGKNGGCDTVVGEFSGRVFEAGEDFREPDTDSGKAFSYTFTGSRVEVTP